MNLRNHTILLAAFLLALGTLATAANHSAGDSSEELKARALANYGKLPLSFEENRGQADPRVKFLSNGNAYSILLSPSQVLLNLRSAGKAGLQQSAIRMSFPGANSSPMLAGGERQAALSSYFMGKDPAKWVTGAPNYARVRYLGVYPGVDLAFYGNQGQLEYDFVLAPGADPKAIRLQFDGADGMHLDHAGNLVLSAVTGEIVQHKPVVYQERAGVRQTIEGRYVIQAHNQVEFEIASYDSRKPLVVDPTLSFATYLGTPGEEVFGLSAAASTATYPAVAVDSQGNVYVTGYNGGNASQFPGHPGILEGSGNGVGGGTDVFVVKMNPSGTELLYSVVLGGGLTDIGGGIAVDTSGNAYITGYTNSSYPSSASFPVTSGAPQSVDNGGYNAFVTKINSSGTALVYSTYLGGGGNYWGRAIAVDHSGNAYVTGTASASGGAPFPLVNPIYSGPSSGFLTEVNASGTAFAYSTYLPTGIGYGIAVDSAGNAYVTGSNGNAIQPSPAQGFVLKVNAGAAGYTVMTLLGNSGAGLQTIGFGIAVDASGNVYATGMTNDPNFPQLTGAAQSTYGGGISDGFVVKLNSSSTLEYGTYLGGLGSNVLPERGSGIGVDSEGNAYVAGTTQCIGFPKSNAIAGALNGSPTTLMEGTVSGTTSHWSPTSLAGTFDQVDALAFDPSGNLYAGASAVDAAGGGVYKMLAGSGTWEPAGDGITTTTINSIAVDPNTPATVYAVGNGHLYKTTNSAGSWTELSQSVSVPAVLAVAKTSPSTVYVGSSTGLSYSTTAGSSWSNPTTPPPVGAINAIVVDPNSAKTAYAGTASGVYQTVNAGVTWTAVNTGLPTGPGGVVTGMAVYSGSNPSRVYAATPNGLFYTSNAIAGWTQVTFALETDSTPLLVAVDAGDDVYVAFQGSGIATATGGGTQQSDWSPLTYNGLTQNQITALAAPPTGSGTAYAGIVAATDAFLTELSPAGAILSSSCIGGADNNLGQSIAVTPGGAALISGLTTATNFPSTPGAVQPNNAGLYDAFVVGIDVPAGITSPLPGIELSDTSDTFTWGEIGGATGYQLSVGTSLGGTNIFNGMVTGTSQTVDFIPCTGGTVYVQLAAEVNGSLQTATDYTYSCKNGIGDFNGDGHQDLVWQNNSTGQVNVNYYGGSTPQPQGSATLNNGSDLAGWKLVGAGDFDHNGVPDLVYQNTATWQVNVNYYGGAGGTSVIGTACISCGIDTTGWQVVAVADFNSDGNPDLVYQNTTTAQVNVDYYGGSGGTTFQGWACLSCGIDTTGWRVAAAADFDGNGTPDLVYQNTGTGQVNVNYYGGTGGAVFQGWACLSCGISTTGWTVVGAMDFNADGVPDLVYENTSSNQVNVDFYGGSKGSSFKGYACMNCGSIQTGVVVGAIAKYGSNGEPGLVWQSSTTNAVTLSYYELGGAVFPGWACLSCGIDTTNWKVVGTGDFDGNGVPDLVYQNTQTGQVNVDYYGGSGGSQFIGWACLSCGIDTTGWQVVAVADFNGDGVPDLVYQNTSINQVNVDYYGGSGGSHFTGWACLSCGIDTNGWRVAAAADFDGNGVPDLVYQNTSSGQVNVDYYGGVGGSKFIGYACLSCGIGTTGWQVVGASDFDGNGVPDLVYLNLGTGQLNVDYYGGAGGAKFMGWSALEYFAGWTPIVPRSR